MEDPGDRKKALLSAFVGASEVDPVGAFAALKTMEGVSSSHYHEVFDNWAETDPAGAAAAALTVESAADRRSALKIVSQEWAERDPEGILAWMKGVDLSSYELETIRKSAVKGFAKRDQIAAVGDLIAVMDSDTAKSKLRALINFLAAIFLLEWVRASSWLRSSRLNLMR